MNKKTPHQKHLYELNILYFIFQCKRLIDYHDEKNLLRWIKHHQNVSLLKWFCQDIYLKNNIQGDLSFNYLVIFVDEEEIILRQL